MLPVLRLTKKVRLKIFEKEENTLTEERIMIQNERHI